MRQSDTREASEFWQSYLSTGQTPSPAILEKLLPMRQFRRFMQSLPADPRCKACRQPFKGAVGMLMRAIGRAPSKLNPQLCNVCDVYIAKNLGGAEVELTMLFADVRGSTALAEKMNPGEYSRIINRFYQESTDVLVRADALIEKLIGDEVAAMFVPGIAGPMHSGRAVDAARGILQATGHGHPDGPWIPVGIGVHRGMAYVGAVGSENGVNDIVALGDTVNTAARLASLAATGEVLVSGDTVSAADLDVRGAEQRVLQLKGRSEDVNAYVLRLAPA